MKYSSLAALFVSALLFGSCSSSSDQTETGENSSAKINLTPEELAVGKEIFTKCAVCHGHNAEGVKAFNAPAIANQETWYLRQQLTNFLEGKRGNHPKDSLGAVMALQAKMLETEEQLEIVIAYIKLLPRVQTDQTIFGDAENGKHMYNKVCATCHGIDAKGLEAYLSPNLLGIQDYYMAAQIRHFRDGIRGISEGDTTGAKMIEMLKEIPDDETIDDVITYIHKLQTEKPKYY
ncbi:MAG: c-type cytochrome [Flavobacteriales bacterium]